MIDPAGGRRHPLVVIVPSVRRGRVALPERERTVLHLRFFESMTQTQIAEGVGLSQMQVSRIMDKTLRTLRDQL